MKRCLPLFLVAPLLAGCLGSAPPVPRDHYYRLLVPTPAQSAEASLLPGVMTVELLQADGLLRERPLLYSESGESYELQQHNYHYWTDAPPRMLQDQMVAYLRRSGVARLVVSPDMRVRADYQVSGKAKRLERLLGGGPPRVFVEIELALLRVSDETLLVVDSYGAEEPAEDESVEAAIVALNRATARVFERFLVQVRATADRMALEQRVGG
ncbi:ABC-type transport auxiliary lipoprotein family protein [Pelagibius sp.]|uniref:ABC-type transport auxiliary lipoprotein family protein n=1 Tax=Pelagibius sp. TaxID=1931238 RepID=UPI002617BA7C|nr:ABC-type transport auxiliary lipoprotein family protein [Pelagibius sp.]